MQDLTLLPLRKLDPMSHVPSYCPSPITSVVYFVFPDRAVPRCSQEHSGQESERGETNGTFTLQLCVTVEREACPESCSHLQPSAQSCAPWVKSHELDRLIAELHAPGDHGVTQVFLAHTHGQ